MSYIQKGTSIYRKTNFSFFAAGFNTFAILYCVQPLFPIFTKQFDISPATTSLSLSLTTITLAIGMLIFGSLSEVWGRKPVMVVSMIAASMICVFTAISPNFYWLLAFRTIQGIALAGLPSIAMAYLSEEMEPKNLGSAMGLYICGNAVGAAFGRVMVGLLTEFFNWHVSILVLGLISLLASLVFWRSLPQSQHFQPKNMDLKNLGMSLVNHLKDPGLLCLFGIGFLLLGCNVALFNYIGYVLIASPYSLNPTLVSWVFLLLLLGTFSSVLSGKMADKHGRFKTLLIGLCITFLGTFLTLNHYLFFKLLGLALFALGFFGSHSIASGWVGKRARTNKAQASSLYLFLYYTGSSIGGTAGGVLWSSMGWDGVFSLVSIFLLIALMLVYTLLKTEKSVLSKLHNISLR